MSELAIKGIPHIFEDVFIFLIQQNLLAKVNGPYADHILIPQGSTGSSTFFNMKWKPIFFWFPIQKFGFKFFVVLEIQQTMWS